MTDNTQTERVRGLDNELQAYIEKEATHYFGFLTRGEYCPKHECPLDLTPDYHIECGICYEEMLCHAIREDQ